MTTKVHTIKFLQTKYLAYYRPKYFTYYLFNSNITPILLRKNKSLGQRTDMQIYLTEKNPSSGSDFKPCQNGSGIIMQIALTQTRTERTSKAIPLMYFQIV